VSEIKNLTASIRQRLLNQAKTRGEDFQRTLVRYAIERLLYRLSCTPLRDRFVLKGAMLFAPLSSANLEFCRDVASFMCMRICKRSSE
jgi:hypothetical protein